MYKNARHTQDGDSRHACCKPVVDDAIIMTYINTQRSASKYTITACRAKVKC